MSIVFQSLFTIFASLFYVSVRDSPFVLLLRKRAYSRGDTRRLSATEYNTMRPVRATAVRDFIVRSFLMFNRSVHFLFYTTRRNLHARRALHPSDRASTLELPLGDGSTRYCHETRATSQRRVSYRKRRSKVWNRIFPFAEGYALDFMYFGYEHDTDPRRDPRCLDSDESCVPQFRCDLFHKNHLFALCHAFRDSPCG